MTDIPTTQTLLQSTVIQSGTLCRCDSTICSRVNIKHDTQCMLLNLLNKNHWI